MTKTPDIPETWRIPDDQTKKIQDALNKEPYPSPMIELMNTISQTETMIADHEPEPSDWTDWIIYLLEQLQVEAEKDFNAKYFETMLVSLRDSLNNRIDRGK